MSIEIKLERLGGTREAAQQTLQPYLTAVNGQPVVLNARRQSVSTEIYVDELVRQLHAHGATHIYVVAASRELQQILRQTAERHNLQDTVHPDQADGAKQLLNFPAEH